MLVRMKTISAGPDPKHSWHPGQIKDVSEDEARELITTGQGETVETATVKPAEKQQVDQPETATIAPAEAAAPRRGRKG